MSDRRGTVLLACVLATLATDRAASGCSCVGDGGPAEALEQAVAVFEGQVVALSREARWIPADAAGAQACDCLVRTGEAFDLCTSDDLDVVLEVTRAWKGAAPGRVRVRTHAQPPACGFPFEIGQSYLVFATEVAGDGSLVTDRCTLTVRSANAKGATDELGPPSRSGFREGPASGR